MKRKLTRYIKELATCGTNIDPDHYKANIALQEVRIIPSYINDIIGWDGKALSEKSYSNHTLAQIKAEMDKFSYDFLTPHFTKWQKILAEK